MRNRCCCVTSDAPMQRLQIGRGIELGLSWSHFRSWRQLCDSLRSEILAAGAEPRRRPSDSNVAQDGQTLDMAAQSRPRFARAQELESLPPTRQEVETAAPLGSSSPPAVAGAVNSPLEEPVVGKSPSQNTLVHGKGCPTAVARPRRSKDRSPCFCPRSRGLRDTWSTQRPRCAKGAVARFPFSGLSWLHRCGL